MKFLELKGTKLRSDLKASNVNMSYHNKHIKIHSESVSLALNTFEQCLNQIGLLSHRDHDISENKPRYQYEVLNHRNDDNLVSRKFDRIAHIFDPKDNLSLVLSKFSAYLQNAKRIFSDKPYAVLGVHFSIQLLSSQHKQNIENLSFAFFLLSNSAKEQVHSYKICMANFHYPFYSFGFSFLAPVRLIHN